MSGKQQKMSYNPKKHGDNRREFTEPSTLRSNKNNKNSKKLRSKWETLYERELDTKVLYKNLKENIMDLVQVVERDSVLRTCEKMMKIIHCFIEGDDERPARVTRIYNFISQIKKEKYRKSQRSVSESSLMSVKKNFSTKRLLALAYDKLDLNLSMNRSDQRDITAEKSKRSRYNQRNKMERKTKTVTFKKDLVQYPETLKDRIIEKQPIDIDFEKYLPPVRTETKILVSKGGRWLFIEYSDHNYRRDQFSPKSFRKILERSLQFSTNNVCEVNQTRTVPEPTRKVEQFAIDTHSGVPSESPSILESRMTQTEGMESANSVFDIDKTFNYKNYISSQTRMINTIHNVYFFCGLKPHHWEKFLRMFVQRLSTSDLRRSLSDVILPFHVWLGNQSGSGVKRKKLNRTRSKSAPEYGQGEVVIDKSRIIKDSILLEKDYQFEKSVFTVNVVTFDNNNNFSWNEGKQEENSSSDDVHSIEKTESSQKQTKNPRRKRSLTKPLRNLSDRFKNLFPNSGPVPGLNGRKLKCELEEKNNYTKDDRSKKGSNSSETSAPNSINAEETGNEESENIYHVPETQAYLFVEDTDQEINVYRPRRKKKRDTCVSVEATRHYACHKKDCKEVSSSTSLVLENENRRSRRKCPMEMEQREYRTPCRNEPPPCPMDDGRRVSFSGGRRTDCGSCPVESKCSRNSMEYLYDRSPNRWHSSESCQDPDIEVIPKERKRKKKWSFWRGLDTEPHVEIRRRRRSRKNVCTVDPTVEIVQRKKKKDKPVVIERQDRYRCNEEVCKKVSSTAKLLLQNDKPRKYRTYSKHDVRMEPCPTKYERQDEYVCGKESVAEVDSCAPLLVEENPQVNQSCPREIYRTETCPQISKDVDSCNDDSGSSLERRKEKHHRRKCSKEDVRQMPCTHSIETNETLVCGKCQARTVGSSTSVVLAKKKHYSDYPCSKNYVDLRRYPIKIETDSTWYCANKKCKKTGSSTSLVLTDKKHRNRQQPELMDDCKGNEAMNPWNGQPNRGMCNQYETEEPKYEMNEFPQCYDLKSENSPEDLQYQNPEPAPESPPSEDDNGDQNVEFQVPEPQVGDRYLSQQVGRLRCQLQAAQGDNIKLQKQIDLLTQTNCQQRSENEKMLNKQADLNRALNQMQKSQIEMEGQLRTLQGSKMLKQQAELECGRQNQMRAEAEKKLKSLEEEHEKVLRKLDEAKNIMCGLKKHQEQAESRINALETECKKQKCRQEEAEEMIEDLNAIKNDQELKIKTLERENECLKHQNDDRMETVLNLEKANEEMFKNVRCLQKDNEKLKRVNLALAKMGVQRNFQEQKICHNGQEQKHSQNYPEQNICHNGQEQKHSQNYQEHNIPQNFQEQRISQNCQEQKNAHDLPCGPTEPLRRSYEPHRINSPSKSARQSASSRDSGPGKELTKDRSSLNYSNKEFKKRETSREYRTSSNNALK